MAVWDSLAKILYFEAMVWSLAVGWRNANQHYSHMEWQRVLAFSRVCLLRCVDNLVFIGPDFYHHLVVIFILLYTFEFVQKCAHRILSAHEPSNCCWPALDIIHLIAITNLAGLDRHSARCCTSGQKNTLRFCLWRFLRTLILVFHPIQLWSIWNLQH